MYKLPQWPTTLFTWTLMDDNGNEINVATADIDQDNQFVLNPEGLLGITNISYPYTMTLRCEYFNTLLGCGGFAEKEINLKQPALITGPEYGCVAEPLDFSLENANANITWYINKGNEPVYESSNTILTYAFEEPGTYTLTAISEETCLSEPFTVMISENPQPPSGPIDGELEVCAGSPYTYSLPSPNNNITYDWEVTNGVIQGENQGNEITVIFDNNPSGNYEINVYSTSNLPPYCESETSFTQVIQPLSINATISLTNPTPNPTYCTSTSTGFEVDYQDGEVYEWSISPSNFGSIINGQNSSQIEVNWNEIANSQTNGQVNLSIRKCGVFYPVSSFPVILEETPELSFNLPSSVCAETLMNINVNSNIVINSYTAAILTVDGEEYTNVTNNGNNLLFSDVLFENVDQNISKTISVSLIDANGCLSEAEATGQVTVLPAPTVAISASGGTGFCEQADINTTLVGNLQGGSVQINSWKWFYQSGNGPIQVGNTNSLSLTSSSNFGYYYLEASAQNNCSITTTPILIEQVDCVDPPPCEDSNSNLTLTTHWNSCNEITATATFSTAVGTPSVSWSFSNGLTLTSQNVNNQTATATFSVDETGFYNVAFLADYPDPYCDDSIFKQAVVGYQADLRYELSCDSGAYTLNLYNDSTFLDGYGFSASDVEFSVDGNPINNNNNPNMASISVTSGNIYDLALSISKGSNPVCSFSINDVVIPDLPNANFSIPNITCSSDAVVPVINAGYNPDFTYVWEFSNTSFIGYDAEFTLEAGPNLVKLNITGPHGCSDVYETTINVEEASFSDSYEPVPTVCIGESITLTYDPGLFGEVPSSYQWMEGTTAIPGATNSSYTTNSPGSYWLTLTDSSGCKDYITPEHAVFYQPPHAQITGPSTVCTEEEFELQGINGSANLEYRWLRDGDEIINWNSNFPANLTWSELQTGTYHFVLEIRNTQTGCEDATATEVLVVEPATLSVEVGYESCEPYTATLTAIGPNNGTYLWSNGNNGQSITVNHSGPYQVTYIPENGGCESSITARVAPSPDEYAWFFPTGCYEFCRRDNKGAYIAVPNHSYTTSDNQTISLWNYIVNGNINSNGLTEYYPYPGDDFVPGKLDVMIGTAGNPDCKLITGTLHITESERCEDCKFDIDIDQVVMETSPYTYYNIYGSITNTTNVTLTFQLTPKEYGTNSDPTYMDMFFQPNTITLPPGQTYVFNPLVFFENSSTFDGGNVHIVITAKHKGKIYCVQKEFSIDFPQNFDRPSVDLKAYPNPTVGQTSLTYDLSEQEFQHQVVKIYNLQGLELMQQRAPGKKGELHFELSSLPSGNYIAVFFGDGEKLGQQIIVKN